MFTLKELIISKTNVLKIPAMQYFPIAFKKRLKNTLTSSEKINKCRVEKSAPNPSVKHCLMMGYSGTKYFGMQYQCYDNVATIEGVLLEAMVNCKWIDDETRRHPHRMQFCYGSRTDRGVSALRQCCSILLPAGLNVDDINKKLPDDIRVFGLQRVPRAFNARYSCTSRTYTYTLPTIAFSHYNDQSPQKGYRVPGNTLESINDLLQVYKGRRNYHNFTIGKTFADKSSYRDILHVECDAPFLVDDVEFCTIRLQGRSFMMHQIRKMMGLFLAVARGVTDRSVYDMVFTDRPINCPTAPGLGLVLNRLHFDAHDEIDGEEYGKVTGEEWEDSVQEFFEQKVKSNIVRTEVCEEQMYEWVEFLLNYLYIPEELNREFALSPKGCP